jgi:hypothetical protein
MEAHGRAGRLAETVACVEPLAEEIGRARVALEKASGKS